MRSTILRPPVGARPVTRLAAALILLLAATATRLDAHEIPSRVTVLAFVKPEGDRLRIVLRAPLEAMRDTHFPERGLGYLDLQRAGPMARDAAQLWIANFIEAYEDGERLSDARVIRTRISLPSERAFTSFDAALAHVLGAPLDPRIDIPWQQALLDVVIEFPVRSARSNFAIRPQLGRLGLQTTTVLRFITPAGDERAYQYVGDPGLVRLDPRWYHAAGQFVRLGIAHILGGLDHLLFVLCLVIPFRRLRPLVLIVTAFTVAHSITLVSSAVGIAPDALWFPPLIETLIAASIVYMALENIVGPRVERRWLIAFGFGLVHGFGFSFALRESLQFAGPHLATSLFTFNLGVEIGQLLVLAAAVPLVSWAFRHVVAERMGIILLSALVAHTAWHWMLDRGAALREYEFTFPPLDLALLASAMRGAIVLLVIALAAWAMRKAARRYWPASITACILLLAGRDAAAQTSNGDSTTTATGVYTVQQAMRGKDVYAGNCRGCHTPDTHTGPTFHATWDRRALSELFGYIRERMPKNDPGSLEPQDYADVLAYVLQLNRMPAGDVELAPDSAALRTIRIAPSPPVRPDHPDEDRS